MTCEMLLDRLNLQTQTNTEENKPVENVNLTQL